MNIAFSNISFLSHDSYSGTETIVVAPSTTYTSKPFSLTFWDSKDGVFFTIVGTRYGTLTTDVQVTLEQATLADAPDSEWETVVAAIDFGTGGTVGTPASEYLTIGLFPTAGQTLMPFMRVKIEAQAASGASITKFFRTTRGR
jgi:hypothetical protein